MASTTPVERAGASGGAGRPGGLRRKFKHDTNTSVVVTDGYMSLDDAETVFIDSIKIWGFPSSSESTRADILGPLSEVLRQGTSGERKYDKVSFVHDGKVCSLDVLRSEAAKRDSSENPVRVWARSYKNGEIAVRIYDMLADPNNAQFREEAVLDYGATLDMAHLCFDIAEAAIKYPGMMFSQVERIFVKMSTASKVRESRSMFVASNDGGSAQQVSANLSSGKGAPGPAVSNTTSNAPVRAGGYEQRANFAAMR